MLVGRSGYRDGDSDILGEIWHCWHEAGLRMPVDAWATPSRLGDWTVRELYAHVGRGVVTSTDLLAQPAVDGEPDLPDAAAYFAALRPLGSSGATQVADTARTWASACDNDILVEVFGATAAKAVDELSVDATKVVRGIAGTIRVGDYVVTRILEATVHLLDLADVASHVRPPSRDAMDRTIDVLVDLTPPAEFVRLATGRPSVPVFPVLT